MKKLLLTFVAAVSSLFAGSGTAWADDEVCVFTGKTASNTTFFTITGNYANTKGSAEVDGTTYTECLKMESSTSIKFTTAQKATLKVVCASTETASIKVDGTTEAASSGNVLTTTIDAGEHELKKSTTVNVFYIGVSYLAVEKPEGAVDVVLTNAFNTTPTEQPFVVTPVENDICLTSGFTYTGLEDKGLDTQAVSTTANKSMKLFQGKDEDFRSASSNHQLEFTFVPKKGITFVVTEVSFDAAKSGSNNPTVTALIGPKGGTAQTIVSAAALQRDNASPYYTTISKSFSTGIECTKDNYLVLTIQPILYDYRSIALSDIVIKGYYTGTAEEEETFEVTTSVNDETYGSVLKSPTDAVASGIPVSLTAVPNTGYNFVRWEQQNESAEWETLSTANPYTIASLSANVAVKAVFEVAPSLTFSLDESTTKYAGSVLPSTIYGAGANTTATIPANYLCYVEGYTFSGWLNGTDVLSSDSTFTFTDLVETPLVAKYVENTQNVFDVLSSLNAEKTLTWTFAKSTVELNYQNKTGVYVKTVQLNGESYDVPMIIDATKGKLNNISRTDALAQCNGGTILRVPVCQNAVIVVKANNAFKASGKTATTINGSSDYTLTNEDKTATYTYKGSENTLDIEFGTDAQYIESVAVTYPANAYSVTISSIAAATLYLPKAVTIPEGVEAYTGVLSDDNSTLTLNKVEDVIPAEEAVVILGDAGTYSFPISTEAGTKAESNSLKGMAEAGTPSEEGAVVTVLDKVNDKLGFYKWTGAIPANKAYLPVATKAAASAIRVVFGNEPGNVTGIESVAAESNANAPIFNLAGQKVNGRMAPGFYIQGGKKMLVK